MPLEVSASSNSPRAYDGLALSSIKNTGSFIPFVVTQEGRSSVMINFGSEHNKIVKRVRGRVVGAGSVVRENKETLLMLPSHHKHGSLTAEQAIAVQEKLAVILGEKVTIGEVSQFKGKKVKK